MAAAAARSWLAGGAGLALAVAIAITGVAVSVEQSDPALALRLRSDDPEAGAALAMAQLNEGHAAAARDAAREALQRQPLNVGAMTALGLAEAKLGQADAADRVLSLAASRSWWPTPAHDWLLRRRLDQGRFAEAYAEADSLLRRAQEGPGRDALISTVVASSVRPGAAEALAARLQIRPPWRALLLQALGRSAPADRAAAVVFTRLALDPRRPIPPEYALYVNRLVGERRYGEALDIWRRLYGDLPSGDLGTSSDGSALTWSLPQAAGATAEITPAGLAVDFDGSSAAPLPERLMVLAPGRYRLTGDADLEGKPPLAWQVRCDENGMALGTAAVAVSLDLTFTVPAQGCAAQWLALGADPVGRPGPVSVTFHAFHVTRLD